MNAEGGRVLRAGACALDITPRAFPVIICGSFMEKTAMNAQDRLHARSLVLDDGERRVAITIVDSGMLPRELTDEAKKLASAAAGIAEEDMLIAATHTHAAPAAGGALGTRRDEVYAGWLPGRIAESIIHASRRLEPAQIGWAAARNWRQTNCRRWITHPDRMIEDPFGVKSARAMMHPGHMNPDFAGPAGPTDPELWLLALRSRAGHPIAVLANYAMHYFGSLPVSADYYGRFADGIGPRIGASPQHPCVGMMSQGASGDQHWMDYSQSRRDGYTIDQYTEEMFGVAAEAYRAIAFRDWVRIGMNEARLTLRRRTPDRARLAWAKKTVATMAGKPPADKAEVYAREQFFLKEEPKRELKIQALCLGDLGICALPVEALAITGLKLKAASPLPDSFIIGLANGSEGYIPPAEQHRLGGYITWPARSAGLEVAAERKILRGALALLEQASGKPRRRPRETHGPYARAVIGGKPLAYWRLNEFGPPTAFDASNNKRHAAYEGNMAFYLPGAQAGGGAIAEPPETPSAFSENRINRAPHFAGGRVRAELGELSVPYTVLLWLWNGLIGADSVARYCLSLEKASGGDYLGVRKDRLVFAANVAHASYLQGRTPLGSRIWRFAGLVRGRDFVRVFLDGKLELEADAPPTQAMPGILCIGSPSHDAPGFEGRLDEVSVYNRALSHEEITGYYRLVRPAEA
ncbi:MAG: hypothetical protein J0L97_06415 [Alphaproteobacteria bacterium]|nr:hypothetical protein [Alphaproteobacteria bacterium]